MVAGQPVRVFRPLFVRVLSVAVWVLLVAFAVMSAMADHTLPLRLLPLLVLLAALAYGLFWRPCVKVDDDGVTLVNVVREVRVPFAVLDTVDTRFALTLGAGDRRYQSWAAPAPGRTSGMGLARREAAAVAHLGLNLDGGLHSSAAPNTDSGGAALLVQHEWQRWLSAAGKDPVARDMAAVTVRWQVPLIVLLALSAAGTVLGLAGR